MATDKPVHPVWVPIYDARAFVLSALGAHGCSGPVMANGKIYFAINGYRYVVTVESDE